MPEGELPSGIAAHRRFAAPGEGPEKFQHFLLDVPIDRIRVHQG